MSALASEIQRGGITGTDEEIALIFTGTVEEHRDVDPWNWDRLIERLIGLGVDKQVAYDAHKTFAGLPGGELFVKMIDTGTIKMSDSVFQLLTDMGKGQTQDVLDLLVAVKKCGVQTSPYWQKLGLSSEPSPEDVAIAKQEILARAWVAKVQEEIFNDGALNNKTITDLKTAIAKAE